MRTHTAAFAPTLPVLLAALVAVGALLGTAGDALAQSRESIPEFLLDPAYRASRTFEKKALHDGNEVAITVHNYGLLAGIGEVRGNWPKGSNDFYVGDVWPIVAAEVPVDRDCDGVPDDVVRHAVSTRGPGLKSPNGPPGNPNVAWTFEPIPGFASPQGERLALSTDPDTWPAFWPDEPTWIDPVTGTAQWNGFFGRDIRNADLESYFWVDDSNDLELQSSQDYCFQPDSTDASRGGMGLAMKMRGLQWSQFLAQDALFMLYEVTNTSTTTYPRVAVGLNVGTLAGGDGDSQDDLAFFDQANRIVYSWDFDDSGNENQDVGYVGYGFLESPGDHFNGIDDDGDGDPDTDLGRNIEGVPYADPALVGTENTFNASDFQPRTLAEGDPLILIDDETGERSVVYLGSGATTVTSQGITYEVAPGQTLEEVQRLVSGQIDDILVTERNLIDEDLDGLLDEDVNLHFERRKQALDGSIVMLPALRYKNYVGLAEATRNRTATRADSITYGLLNPMIDEARADGIDNDGDWNPIGDDVGADGVAGTGDRGEGDGVPTPGEPNFDELDVDESDQVGLTSFFYFTPPGAIRMNNDERVWESLNPGFFTTNEELAAQQGAGGVDGDFIFGSGYFRLRPGETLRFSFALVFGSDLEDITNNTITIQEIYDRNYQFARPPDRPNLRAVPGDGQVTLYWDDVAEASVDPILGMDFEGYRLYKSTDPFFRDPEVVTDFAGNPALVAPLAQFDLKNGINGLWPATGVDYSGAETAADSIRILQTYLDATERVNERTRGTPYFLGNDTGLRYSFVDTDVQNGRTYYYGLTAYDRGSADFFPAENNLPATVSVDGSVITGANVVEVTPDAPAAGYVAGRLAAPVVHAAGPATGELDVEVLDPGRLVDGASYRLTFSGSTLGADSFTITADGDTVVSTRPLADVTATIFDGMRLVLVNDQARLDSTYFQDVSNPDVAPLDVALTSVTSWEFSGRRVPYDYEIVFDDQLVGRSTGGIKLGSRGPTSVAEDVNFRIVNTTLGTEPTFVFIEGRTGDNGRFDTGGEAIFLFEDVNGTLTPTYGIRFRTDTNNQIQGAAPSAGDVFVIETDKPFLPFDVYTFSTTASAVDEELARGALDDIRVVPNPYVAAAAWEAPLPPTITSGRGERRIDFTKVPAGARIRIYSVRGELVDELFADDRIESGKVSWDLRTREGLEVAYGVYFYHVEAPGIGETTGKFAIIK